MLLSEISTVWSEVFAAHDANPATRREAQAAFVHRYSGPVYRYLRTVLGDAEAADEVFQQFWMGFIEGAFRAVDPSKGRFRDYLKTSLLRMVCRYRRQRTHLTLTAAEQVAWEAFSTEERLAEAIDAAVREDLLSRAWLRLKDWQDHTGWPYFSVLDYRARYPQATSQQMARALAGLGSPGTTTAAGIRKTLQRARAKYTNYLVQELAATLGDPSLDELEEEAIHLGLHAYCRVWLKRRRAESAR